MNFSLLSSDVLKDRDELVSSDRLRFCNHGNQWMVARGWSLDEARHGIWVLEHFNYKKKIIKRTVVHYVRGIECDMHENYYKFERRNMVILEFRI